MTNLVTGDTRTFAAGLGKWIEYANASRFALTHSTAEGGVGQIDVTNGGVNMSIGTSRDTDPLTAKYAVTPGNTVTVGCRARYIAGASRNFRMNLEFYDSANAYVTPTANFVPSSFPAALNAAWTTYTGTVTVPAGAAGVQLTMRFDAAVTGDSYQFDDIVLDDGVGAGNTPPTANAGPDQTVASGAFVTLTGTDSDPDGTITSRSWTQTSGPAVTLSGTGATRTFTAPTGPATLVFSYSVTDNGGATTADSVTINVNAAGAGGGVAYNETFATNLANWYKVTGTTNFNLAHSTADGGVAELDVTVGGTNISTASHQPGTATKPAVVAGKTYTISATVKQVDGLPRNWRVEANWYNSAGTALEGGSNIPAASGVTQAGVASTISGNLLAPATATMIRLRVWIEAPAAGETFRLDNVSVTEFVQGGGGPAPTGVLQVKRRVGGVWTATVLRDVSPAPTGPRPITLRRVSVTTAPSATVTNVRVVAGDGQATVSWTEPNPADDVTDYVVEHGEDSAGPWTADTDAVSLATTKTVAGLVNGISYWFRVAPVRSGTVGTFSAPVTATPAGTPGPSNLVASPGDAAVTLTWSAPVPATGVTDYSVQYRRATVATWTTFPHAVSTVTRQTVTGLPNSVQHVFQVAAVRSGVVGTYTAGPVTSTPVASAPTGSLFDEHVGFGNPGLTVPVQKTVTTLADSGAGSLREAVAGSAHKYIVFAAGLAGGTIQLTSGSIRPGSNTVIDGRGRNITVKGNNTTTGFILDLVHNVTVADIAVTDCGNLALTSADDPYDCFELRGVDHVWLHHVELARASDKAVAMNLANKHVTVSWCHFHDQEQVFQSGNDFDGETQGSQARLTIHHTWWNVTGYRHPVISYGLAHVYNNYYDNFANYGTRSQRIAKMWHERNVIRAVRNARVTLVSGTGGATKDTRPGFLMVEGNVALPGSLTPQFETSSHDFRPSAHYSYTADTAGQALADAIVAGAGPR